MYHHEGIMQHLRINPLHINCDVLSQRVMQHLRINALHITLENQRYTY